MPQGLRRLTHSGGDRRAQVLVAAGLAVYVGLVYAVVVLGGGVLVGQSRSPNLGLSVIATAIVAISFEAVQTRLERLTTDLLHIRPSPYEVLSRFAGTARAADAEAGLPQRMARLLAEGTGAAAAQVWLVVGEQRVLAASWPPSAEAALAPPPLSDSTHLASPGGWRSLPVLDGAETLGVLSLREHDDRPLTPIEERLFAGLAVQAGLVLRSARLRAELSQRLVELSTRAEELRRSRERVIETQDDERKKLERDIHDGAQQNLVALAVNLRLADAIAARAPERAAKVLAEQSAAARQAIDTLTQLSRGIYPAVLAEHGLVPALHAIAANAVVLSVDVNADESIRLGTDLEAALYFCCLEALQNAAKHSGAGRASVGLDTTPDGVRLTVRDDGRGFDPARTPTGSGTANMRDRIDAVGGTWSLIAAPGAGTCIEAYVPAPVTSGRVT
jgi:signal transduction histidine kinase